MAQIDNLSLDLRDDGVHLTFVAASGAAVALDIGQLAAREKGAVREVLLAWCEDRRARRKPQTLAEQSSPLLVQDYAD